MGCGRGRSCKNVRRGADSSRTPVGQYAHRVCRPRLPPSKLLATARRRTLRSTGQQLRRPEPERLRRGPGRNVPPRAPAPSSSCSAKATSSTFAAGTKPDTICIVLHESLDNKGIEIGEMLVAESAEEKAAVVCESWLGGVLRHYRRAAAWLLAQGGSGRMLQRDPVSLGSLWHLCNVVSPQGSARADVRPSSPWMPTSRPSRARRA